MSAVLEELTPAMFAALDDAPASQDTSNDKSEQDAEAGSAIPASSTERTSRDERGRFAAGQTDDTTPAPEAAAPPATTPPAPTTTAEPTEETPDWRVEAEKLQRQLASVRGQVANAAKQAREQAEREFQERQRAEVRQRLGELAQQGEDVTQLRSQYERQWADQDQEVRRREEQGQRASFMLEAADLDSRHKLLTLYQHGATVLAEDTGLPVDEVRAFWNDPEERLRFERAAKQAKMAETLPGAGFNAAALDDYMQTAVSALKQQAGIRKTYSEQLAARDKEIARLQQELNRLETDSPGLRPEPPSRGAATRRRASSPDEQMARVLEENAADLFRAFNPR